MNNSRVCAADLIWTVSKFRNDITIPYIFGGNKIEDQYFICCCSDGVWIRNDMGMEKRTFRERDTYFILHIGNTCIDSCGERHWKFYSKKLCKSDNGVTPAFSNSHDIQTYEIFDGYVSTGSGNSGWQISGQASWCGVRFYRSGFYSLALLFAYWGV